LRWETFLDTEIEINKREEDETKRLNEGDGWLEKHKNSFGLSILSFVVSSGAMAIGFLVSVK
jgi:hypothetical protein